MPAHSSRRTIDVRAKKVQSRSKPYSTTDVATRATGVAMRMMSPPSSARRSRANRRSRATRRDRWRGRPRSRTRRSAGWCRGAARAGSRRTPSSRTSRRRLAPRPASARSTRRALRSLHAPIQHQGRHGEQHAGQQQLERARRRPRADVHAGRRSRLHAEHRGRRERRNQLAVAVVDDRARLRR